MATDNAKVLLSEILLLIAPKASAAVMEGKPCPFDEMRLAERTLLLLQVLKEAK